MGWSDEDSVKRAKTNEELGAEQLSPGIFRSLRKIREKLEERRFTREIRTRKDNKNRKTQKEKRGVILFYE